MVVGNLKRREIAGIISVVLLFWSIILSIETPYNRPVGDIIFEALGLQSWSNGYTGLHYTLIYSILIFIIGFIGVNLFLKEKHPRFVKRLPVILIIFLISYPILTSTVVKIIKSNSTGLYAIHYLKKDSEINFETSRDEEFLIVEGSFKFRNYSDKEMKFYIKYLDNEMLLKEISIDKEIVAVYPDTNEPQLFIIQPKSTVSIKATFKLNKKIGADVKGWSKEVDISIFNEQEEIKFIESNIWGISS